MYPAIHAASVPDKPAVIMARSGEVITYGVLDERSIRLARVWQEAGLSRGDHVAIFMENHARFFEVVWAALRSGLYITTINSYLTAPEVAYILSDSGSRSLVTSPSKAGIAVDALREATGIELPLLVDEDRAGFERYEDRIAAVTADPLDAEPAGELMLYSSGTTGRPKGIERPLRDVSVAEGMATSALLGGVFGFTSDSVYLSPAPLYHSAPIGFTTGVQSLGGTVVVMERYDPLDALRLIEEHRVTCSQWVPTMFVRMLKVSEEERTRHDLSSHQIAVHAAAPCPVTVKQQMMDWWGPILWEYYAGTELNGFCLATPDDWLAHPGTVGKPLIGDLHILDEDGIELEPYEPGTIYFGGGSPYVYHNDPDKTRSVQDPKGRGWTTLGDVGYVDDEGWLYLTDRKAFMIISGGVNIYPQETENALITHPAVEDVAVFGVPNEEMGEEVKAVVQLLDPSKAGPEMERELVEFCRERLAHYKCPRTIDFEAELPRLPTGKLYKQKLRDRYWSNGKE